MKISYEMDFAPDICSFGGMTDELAEALPFRVDSCGRFDCGPAYYTEREGMGNYLMIFTLSGQGEVDLGTGRHKLTAGSVTVMDCMRHHYYGTCAGMRWKFLYVHFSGCMDAFAPILAAGGPVIWPESPELFNGLMDRLISAVERREVDGSLICNELLTRMLTQLAVVCHGARADGAVQRHGQALNELCAYLRESYDRPVTLEEMADRMHMSKYHFVRVFSAYAHMTPAAYLIDIRLNAARSLLITGGASVREIAEKTGFADSNSLIRSFKKRFQMTPTRYRALWRGHGDARPEKNS